MNFNAELANTLPHGFFVLDPDDNVCLWNNWLAEASAIPADAICGHKLADFFELTPHKRAVIRTVRNDRRPYVLSFKVHKFLLPIKLPSNDISGFPHMLQECHLVPVPNAPGFIAVSIRNVTSIAVGEHRIQSLRADLRAALAKAEHAYANQSDFFAMIAHDIRTPMYGILGTADLLLDPDQLAPDQIKGLQTIAANGQLLLALLNDILDLSKMQANKFVFRNEDFATQKLFTHCLHLNKPQADLKGLLLHFDWDPAIPDFARGDTVRIQQIILNLLSNAIKFTQQGTVRLAVRLRAPQPGNALSLEASVSDSGCGLSQEAIDKLFVPFERIEDAYAKRIGGFGLGLVITRKLCEAMNGTISVQSTPNQGATFTATFDLQHAAQPTPLSSPNPNSPYRPAKLLRIMVIDDNLINSDLTSRFLARDGHTATPFNNPEQAAIALQSQPFDCIFTDLLMARLSGANLASNLRDGRYGTLNQNIPVIAISGLADAAANPAYATCGIDCFLTKPIHPKDLRQALDASVFLSNQLPPL